MDAGQLPHGACGCFFRVVAGAANGVGIFGGVEGVVAGGVLSAFAGVAFGASKVFVQIGFASLNFIENDSRSGFRSGHSAGKSYKSNSRIADVICDGEGTAKAHGAKM